jgi:hypothetical protein
MTLFPDWDFLWIPEFVFIPGFNISNWYQALISVTASKFHILLNPSFKIKKSFQIPQFTRNNVQFTIRRLIHQNSRSYSLFESIF